LQIGGQFFPEALGIINIVSPLKPPIPEATQCVLNVSYKNIESIIGDSKSFISNLTCIFPSKWSSTCP